MEILVNEGSKIVEIWLTNAEQRDQSLRARMEPLCRECREQKYLPVVFASGQRDLTEATGDLLRYNRRRGAEREGRGNGGGVQP